MNNTERDTETQALINEALGPRPDSWRLVSLIEELGFALERATNASPATREQVAAVIQSRRYMGKVFPASNPQDFREADVLLAAFTITERAD